jgi:hypothetical protein
MWLWGVCLALCLVSLTDYTVLFVDPLSLPKFFSDCLSHNNRKSSVFDRDFTLVLIRVQSEISYYPSLKNIVAFFVSHIMTPDSTKC